MSVATSVVYVLTHELEPKTFSSVLGATYQILEEQNKVWLVYYVSPFLSSVEFEELDNVEAQVISRMPENIWVETRLHTVDSLDDIPNRDEIEWIYVKPQPES